MCSPFAIVLLLFHIEEDAKWVIQKNVNSLRCKATWDENETPEQKEQIL